MNAQDINSIQKIMTGTYNIRLNDGRKFIFQSTDKHMEQIMQNLNINEVMKNEDIIEFIDIHGKKDGLDNDRLSYAIRLSQELDKHFKHVFRTLISLEDKGLIVLDNKHYSGQPKPHLPELNSCETTDKESNINGTT